MPKVCARKTTLLRIADSSGHFYLCSPGSRRFKIAYNRALPLEQKTTSGLIQGLNTLLKNLSSWAAITDGPSDIALPDPINLEQLNEVKWAWEKARDSMRAALGSLTSERVQ